MQCRGQAREPVRRAGRPGAEQPRGVDPFDPGQQDDAQQPGDTEPDLGLAVLQSEELDDAQFWTWEEAEAKMPANTAARIPAARQARKNQRTIYLPAFS